MNTSCSKKQLDNVMWHSWSPVVCYSLPKWSHLLSYCICNHSFTFCLCTNKFHVLLHCCFFLARLKRNKQVPYKEFSLPIPDDGRDPGAAILLYGGSGLAFGSWPRQSRSGQPPIESYHAGSVESVPSSIDIRASSLCATWGLHVYRLMIQKMAGKSKW